MLLSTQCYVHLQLNPMDKQQEPLSRMLAILHQALQEAESSYNSIRQQVLNLERKINYSRSAQYVVKKPAVMVEAKVEQAKKEQQVSEAYKKKIEEIISSVNNSEKQLEQMVKPKPIIKTKEQLNRDLSKNIKVEEPKAQKKPPVPTVNRSKQPTAFVPKPNYHYRNRNEVTAKITQTPIIKQNAKGSVTVFKKEGESSGGNAEKKNLSVSKVKQSTAPVTAKNNEVSSSKQEKMQQASKSALYFHSPLSVSIEQLVQRIRTQTNGSITAKKQKIKQKIEKYKQQQKGYRERLQDETEKFLKSCNKLGATRRNLPLQPTLSTQSRHWPGSIETFNFMGVVENIQSLMADATDGEQSTVADDKQLYRISCWLQLANQYFQSFLSKTNQNLKPPPLLGVDFPMATPPLAQPQLSAGQPGNHLASFYTELGSLLEQLKGSENLDKQSLRRVRMLVSVCLHQGRRSPVIVQQSKYQLWQEYYHQ